MKYGKVGAYSLAFLLAITAFGSAHAKDIRKSGFLSDYSKLKQSNDKYQDYAYLTAGAPDNLVKYTAVMIDQPEIFVAANSKYRGMKPDDMKTLADTFRAAMAQSLSANYMVVDQAGPNVLFLRFAISNVQLKKKRRGVLGYTPIGLVAGVAKSAIISDVTKKIDLKGLTIEMEVLDSTNMEQLAALLKSRSGKKKEPASWSELEGLIALYSKRVTCKLDNGRRSAKDRVDCLSDM
jgi:hypothetical protein